MGLVWLMVTIVCFFSIQCLGNPGQSEKIRIQQRQCSNLCASNELIWFKPLMRLAQCGKVYPANLATEVSNVFTKVPVDNIADTFQLKTDIRESLSYQPPGSENCLYVADVPYRSKLNLTIYTGICNSKESNQYWNFLKVGDSVQWIHKKTNGCVAPIFERDYPDIGRAVLNTELCRKTQELQLWSIVKVKA